MRRHALLGRRRASSEIGDQSRLVTLTAGLAGRGVRGDASGSLAQRRHHRPRLACLLIGLLGGAANGLGSWALFEALERVAKASVAVPLTALYPLVTIVLARIFLAETLTLRQWAGIALAVAGGDASYETEEKSVVEKQAS